MNKMDAEYYRRQIKGLILIMKDNDGMPSQQMISREYLIEKLTMILAGGIGFHPTINKHLDSLEGKKSKCTSCKGIGKLYSELIRENVNCGNCGDSGVDE